MRTSSERKKKERKKERKKEKEIERKERRKEKGRKEGSKRTERNASNFCARVICGILSLSSVVPPKLNVPLPPQSADKLV